MGTVNLSGVPASVLPVSPIDFATQPSTTSQAANILALVANTSSGTGNATLLDFTTVPALIPTGQNAAMYISNRCLLNNFLQPALAGSLSTPASSFSMINGNISTPYTLSLNTDVDIQGAKYSPQLQSMNVYVNDSGQIQGDYMVQAYPIGSGTSVLWVDVNGSFYLTPQLDTATGIVSFNADTPDGTGSVHLSPGGWVLVGFLVVATFGTLGAAAGIVTAVVVPVLITQLNFNVSLASVGSGISSAVASFTWPAQSLAPLTEVSLPGDMILYLNPQT